MYTHRIRSIGPDGIRTRGDINGAEDPWTLHGRDLIGRVAVVLPGVGWLVRSLPVLIGGLALVWLLSGAVRTPHRRFALRLIGVPLVVSAVLLWLKPFINTAVLLTDSQHGRTMARIVSTGLLPVEVSEQGGARIRLSSGQVGDLWLAKSDLQGHFWMSSALALPAWGWGVVGLLCAVPAALAVANGRRRGRHREPRGRRAPPGRRGPHRRGGARRRVRADARRVVGLRRRPELAGRHGHLLHVRRHRRARTERRREPAVRARLPQQHASPTDVSGNGRNGAYTSAATVLASKAPGCPRDPDGIWRLNGTGDCAANTVSLGVLTSSAFSVETWFRTSTTGTSGTLVAYGLGGATPTTNRALYVDNGGKARGWIGGTDSVASAARVDDGQWHFATLVFTPSTGTTLYVDGVLADSASSMSSAASWSAPGPGGSAARSPRRRGPRPARSNLKGDLRFAAVYTSSLTKTQVSSTTARASDRTRAIRTRTCRFQPPTAG